MEHGIDDHAAHLAKQENQPKGGIEKGALGMSQEGHPTAQVGVPEGELLVGDDRIALHGRHGQKWFVVAIAVYAGIGQDRGE